MPTVAPQYTASDRPPGSNNHADLTGLLAGILALMAVLMTAFVGARFYARIVMRRLAPGLADWIMLIAWGVILSCSAILWSNIPYGFGRHSWDVHPDWFGPNLKGVLIFRALFFVGAALTKISVCLTCLQFFPNRKSNIWFCRIAIAFCATWGACLFFLFIFQCNPISDYWHRNRIRRCIEEENLIMAATVINSAADVAVFLWPARFIWGLKLPVSKRLELIGLFCVGCSIAALGLIRIWYQTLYFTTRDLSWVGSCGMTLMAIEADLGIICGCVPTAKQGFVALCSCIRCKRTPQNASPPAPAPGYVAPTTTLRDSRHEPGYSMDVSDIMMSPMKKEDSTSAVAPRILMPMPTFHATMTLDSRFGYSGASFPARHQQRQTPVHGQSAQEE